MPAWPDGPAWALEASAHWDHSAQIMVLANLTQFEETAEMRLEGHIAGVLDVTMEGLDYGDHVQYTMEMVDGDRGELLSSADVRLQEENGTNMSSISGAIHDGAGGELFKVAESGS